MATVKHPGGLRIRVTVDSPPKGQTAENWLFHPAYCRLLPEDAAAAPPPPTVAGRNADEWASFAQEAAEAAAGPCGFVVGYRTSDDQQWRVYRAMASALVEEAVRNLDAGLADQLRTAKANADEVRAVRRMMKNSHDAHDTLWKSYCEAYRDRDRQRALAKESAENLAQARRQAGVQKADAARLRKKLGSISSPAAPDVVVEVVRLKEALDAAMAKLAGPKKATVRKVRAKREGGK